MWIMPMPIDDKSLRPSATFSTDVLDEIHRAADEGIYEIRGFGAKRALPTFDDLVFLGASMSRYPLAPSFSRTPTTNETWHGTFPSIV